MNNDRYLFRGICKETKKWVFGHLITDANGLIYIAERFSFEQRVAYDPEYSSYDSLESSFVMRETVGQWTGLIDKDGVKIFEGDRVIVGYYTQEVNEDHESSDSWVSEEIYSVEWGVRSGVHYPAFYLPGYDSDANSFSDILDGGEFQISVIGSIHDHLLGEKQ